MTSTAMRLRNTVSDNVHRPHPGPCDIYTETDAQGRERTIPRHLICNAPRTVLKDESLRWVSRQEARRLGNLLQQAYDTAWEQWETGEREHAMTIADALEVAAREGYTKIGVHYESPDDGVIEHHYLVRSVSGDNAVIVLVQWDEDGLYLHHILTSYSDEEADCRILRLQSDSDIQLADANGLLCHDANGAHVQIHAWRSVIWQCTEDDDQFSEERLREFWRTRVTSGL